MFLYIDATSGGMVLQVALSGFVGGLVVLKLFWRSVVSTLLRRQPEDDAPPPVTDPTDSPAA